MVNLTEKEIAVLNIFGKNGMEACGASNAEEMHADNMTWTRPSEVRVALRWKAEVVGGVFSSLEAKGLIVDSGETMEGGTSRRHKSNHDWFLSAEGIEAFFIERSKAEDAIAFGDTPPVEAPAEEEVTMESTVRELFTSHGVFKELNLCRGLRSVARDWRQTGGTRKTFLVACEELEIDLGTASTQWQASSKRVD